MRESGIIKKAHNLHALTVLVPRRIGQEFEIVPIDVPEPMVEHNDEGTMDFTWIRSVANVALFRKDHHDMKNYGEPIKEFDPPIEFRIPYGDLELENVSNDISQLKLAYFSPDRWVIISDVFHEYQILPPEIARIAEVKIWSWVGDPTIAWGK